MDLREKTLEGLCSLRFSDISREWVDSIWDENLCSEEVPLPLEEGVLLNEEGWESLVEACRGWTQPENSSESEC